MNPSEENPPGVTPKQFLAVVLLAALATGVYVNCVRHPRAERPYKIPPLPPAAPAPPAIPPAEDDGLPPPQPNWEALFRYAKEGNNFRVVVTWEGDGKNVTTVFPVRYPDIFPDAADDTWLVIEEPWSWKDPDRPNTRVIDMSVWLRRSFSKLPQVHRLDVWPHAGATLKTIRVEYY